MFGVVREATYDTGKKESGSKQIEEFARIRAQQKGYRGSMTVDAGDGRTLIVTLWDSEREQQAGSATLNAEAQRLMGPLFKIPARIIGSGEVIHDDVTKA